MTNEEVNELVKKYFDAEGYKFPGHFEHRVDPDSSAVMYSMIREYKPKVGLQIGTWKGGSVSSNMAAFIKNEQPFTYVASELHDDLSKETEFNCTHINGQAPTMIGDITKNLDKVPKELDFLFHDSDHDHKTTVWVFRHIIPRLKKGALVIFHDWAVKEEGGKWIPKDGAWEETKYMVRLHKRHRLPFEKVYWNYKNPGDWELGVFLR